MTDSNSPFSDRALVIVLTEPGRTVEPAWIDDLKRHFSGEIVASEGGPIPDGVKTLPGSRGPWRTWLDTVDAQRSTNGVFLLAAGLMLPERFAQRLNHALASPDCPPLLTLPGNHGAGLDPAAGLMRPTESSIDSLVNAAAELRFSPVQGCPERLAVIAPGQADKALRLADQGHCWLYDGLWIEDADARDSRAACAPDQRAALGQLRAALGRLREEDTIDSLPLFGFDQRPIVLHISHDWGGGVARWIDDLAADDDMNHHLVFSSSGRTDGVVHGQWLKLYAAGPGRGCIRQWTLAPAIPGTDIEHPQYRDILDAVIRRYGVGRVVVSSLIGHSLDALATRLPTIEMLHDYYPAWPALDHDPFAWIGTDGTIDLDRAIADSGDDFLFSERRAQAWHRLGAAWLQAVESNGVALAAPTEQVLERWRRLLGHPLETARVIPHGFAGWPADTPAVAPRALPDGRLNLVVVGRLSPGKGLGLLDAALAELREHARVTLLGCGRHGMRFFGRPGVDIVLDYRHDDLPTHLARIGPQAALFLSTVAETWNYALSETRALGLVPLATRTGSFIERIDDDIAGLLFEPDPQALAQMVRSLHDNPGRLAALRKNLPEEPPVAKALNSINDLAPLRQAGPRAATTSSGIEMQAAARAAELADLRHEYTALRAQVETLDDELQSRADWARKQERLADERTQWARTLEGEVQTHKRQVAETIERSEAELQQVRSSAEARIDHLDRELQTIFASRSWRITRPMRVANRVAANALRRRIYNPLRWPRLLARLIHNLRLYGTRGTLELMQQGVQPGGELPVGVETVAAPGDELRPVSLEPADDPMVSIIVPVFNKAHYTSACLNSLVERAGKTPIEVIVVDDCSTDDTADYLAQCRGLSVLRNDTNSGFIASCNAGAAAAQGRYLVFLNNDTTVTAGWLDALIDTFSSFPDTGIVGARLVYPDGRLQEAGGIIFSDGSGWNYGRGDQPERPEYSFACEADYVSGACLGIERELFERLGGFDKHYTPAYYEDTDLCFRVREEGLRVIYQPACTIVHHEGISSGTDESSGTKRYQAVNREKFLERWRKQLEKQPAPVPGPEAVDAVYRARHHRRRGHVLVIDATTPEPDKDSGSMRMVAMLTILRDLGYRVSFMPENLAWVARYTRELQTMGVEVLHHPWASSIDDWMIEHGARLDQVIVSRHYVLSPLLPTIKRHCANAALAFDTVDLHFLREERMAEIAGDDKAARMARKTREAELSLIRQADATLVVSPVEQALLQKLEPDAHIRVLSNIHRIHGRRRGWAERRDLVFVGGFQHPPNLDAAEWLIEEIMPLVRRQIPNARLHIIGSRMPESLRERKSDGVIMHGYVADLTPYLEASRLSVAPLRYGAGVKGKVNQAMAWGLPVVATTCAAEGMYLIDGEDVLIADTTEAFAEAVVRAYNDEALWMKLSDGGLANVEKHFSFEAARQAVCGLMELHEKRV